jgi:hypothetical protein
MTKLEKAQLVIEYLQTTLSLRYDVALRNLLDNLEYREVKKLPSDKLAIKFPNVVYFYDKNKSLRQNLEDNEEFTDFLIKYYNL